ncbi:hypothetical protein Curi_c14720 [Gottschalkia acidurici 9a]|uniref:SnoaL-like domain-containing protein n=1 Tax=Gottschalkia acidurici (strain ATCC 7906 / DSM 604 / BCRC 14475 / CIP 104303 / KCTC 5404 / NCIMB 10678 / 9a) TaxID=1128398 RepID=K0B0A9_GOTA9|nr:hypothetical protein [Gottschalkia acidurici]AFS78482.1 hypothetical protein Curi_c14720 [Gottschalkia acidurici 9a]
MNYKEQVIALWDDVDKQNWNVLSRYFKDDFIINWNNINEMFNVKEFVRINAEYPGDWNTKIECLEYIEKLVISVVKVQFKNGYMSFHATSFFEFNNGKIKVLNEYWGDYEKAT